MKDRLSGLIVLQVLLASSVIVRTSARKRAVVQQTKTAVLRNGLLERETTIDVCSTITVAICSVRNGVSATVGVFGGVDCDVRFHRHQHGKQ